MKTGKQPVTRRRVVREDDVSRLFAAKVVGTRCHVLEDITVADRRPPERDSLAIEGDFEAEVAHDRCDNRRTLEQTSFVHRHGKNRHDVIAVDDLSARVDGEASVRVTIVCNPQVGSDLNDSFFQKGEVG